MNIGGGEAADQMVRMLLSGTEVVIRLSGSALKNLLALSLALARNHKKERQRHPKTPTARQDPQTPTQGRQSGQTAPHQADPPKKESRSGRGSRDTRTSSSTPQGQGTMTERPSVEGRLRAYRAQLERSSVPAKEKTKSRPKTR